MLTGFLNTLATIISVTSLLIVTYGALIGVISFFAYCIYNHRTTKTNQKYPSVNL